MAQSRIDAIRDLIFKARNFANSNQVQETARVMPEVKSRIRELKSNLVDIDHDLEQVPQIDVALIGRSRHGKSTLINALAGEEILKTSAIRPCTATIIKLVHADVWSVEIEFVSKKELVEDWKNAVADAREFLAQQDDEADNRYLFETLERFIELFGIDKNLSPEQLVDQVRHAAIPSDIGKLLGKKATPTTQNIETLKRIVSKHLSTEGTNWTIVDRCTIRGPFKNWHPRLGIIDLPGTNDLNAHRSQITNSVRNKAKAVAIVTSESNLGVDIDSWLRESRVLADFLEFKESSRQHLFIIRTQLDNYQPEIDLSNSAAESPPDDELEERLFQEAIDRYKLEQTDAYHDMLKDIVAPLLKASNGSESGVDEIRLELLERITSIPVHFVSALAYEVFQGRMDVGRRRKQNLLADFADDENRTGVPGLLKFLNTMATDYLEKNFYDDLERRVESEVALLGQFFRSQFKSLEVAKSGAGQSVIALTDNVQNRVVPWIQQEITVTVATLRSKGCEGTEAIRHRLDLNWKMSKRRFQDKIDKWNHYAWNSLKATARKQGVHITSAGSYIDIAQDVCSVLVDDLLLVWTSYRDFIIEKQVNRVTQDFAQQLTAKLLETRQSVDNVEAMDAIDEIIGQLNSIAEFQRDDLLRKVDAKIKQLESIRKPAYDYVRDLFRPVFHGIANEGGTGCQQRMRKLLIDGLNNNMNQIRAYIYDLVNSNAEDLLDHCSSAMSDFGLTASSKIVDATNEVKKIQTIKDLDEIETKSELIATTYQYLPQPKIAS